MNVKSRAKNVIIISLLLLILIAEVIYMGFTFSWFTDKIETDNVIMNVGKVDIDLDKTASSTGVQVSAFRDSVRVDLSNGYLLPGDRIDFTLQINNVGHNACYYLVCISTEDTMLAPTFNKYFFYNGTEVCYVKKLTDGENERLEAYKNSDNSVYEESHLGKLDVNTSTTDEKTPNSFHTLTLQHELSKTLEEKDFSNDQIIINCSVYAIQSGNVSELEAYDGIIKMIENS